MYSYVRTGKVVQFMHSVYLGHCLHVVSSVKGTVNENDS